MIQDPVDPSYVVSDAYHFGTLLYEGAAARIDLEVRMQQKFGHSKLCDLNDAEIAWIRREMDGLLYDFTRDDKPGLVPLKILKSLKMKYPGNDGVRILKVHPDVAMRWFCGGLSTDQTPTWKPLTYDASATWSCASSLLFNSTLARVRNRGNVLIPGDLTPCEEGDDDVRFYLICIDLSSDNDENGHQLVDHVQTLDDSMSAFKDCIPWCVTYRVFDNSTFCNVGHLLLCDLSHMVSLVSNVQDYTACISDVLQMANDGSAQSFLHDISSKYFTCPWDEADDRSVRYEEMKKQLGIHGMPLYHRVMSPWYRPQRIWLRDLSSSNKSNGASMKKRCINTVPKNDEEETAKKKAKVLSDLPDKLRVAVDEYAGLYNSIFGGDRAAWVEKLIHGLNVDYYCRGQNPKGRNLYYYRGTATFGDQSSVAFDKVDTVGRLLKRVLVQLKNQRKE
jgi:hypothetical protein